MKGRRLGALILLLCMVIPVFKTRLCPNITDRAILRTKCAVTKAFNDIIDGAFYENIVYTQYDEGRLTALTADMERAEELKGELSGLLTKRLLLMEKMTFKIGVIRAEIALNAPVKTELYIKTINDENGTVCRLSVAASASVTIELSCGAVKTEVVGQRAVYELALNEVLPPMTKPLTREIWSAETF